MDKLPKPVFVFSLPRSSSTLTQRMLAAHEEIATASEPWVLLPYLYTLGDRGTNVEYEHNLATRAIGDFIEVLPEGRQEYLSEMRTFVLRLYARVASDSARYFLDKPPRYDLIVEDVIDLFPEGKFIFLWRNPLSIAASLIETPWGGWGARRGGRWNLYRIKTDLYDGLENLVGAYHRYSTVAHAVCYEDLVASLIQELTGILDDMGLPFDPAVLHDFGMVKLQVELQGEYKDPTGTKLYKQVSREPLRKWKQTLANPLRKIWCRRYLRWIGTERLRAMGYNLEELLAELDSIPTSLQQLGSDALRAGYGLHTRTSSPRSLGTNFVSSLRGLAYTDTTDGDMVMFNATHATTRDKEAEMSSVETSG